MKTVRPVRSLILGGILPVVIFTLVEEFYGTLWGLVAGMVFGVFEIASEWIQSRKVETMTWAGNGLLLVLGGVSLTTSSGIWFKLQPAILELAMAGFLLGSCLMQKPLLVLMAEKQQVFQRLPPPLVPKIKSFFIGITIRLSVFLILHAALASWAAFYWSSRAWAILKGVGFTVSMIVYVVLEGIVLRVRLARAQSRLLEKI